mgnify:CR=1 FL=1
MIIMKEKSSSSVWGIVLKIVAAVATALAGVFGLNSCMS